VSYFVNILVNFSGNTNHITAVQDALWNAKCMRHGWFLPYEPTPSEYGSWKQHYIACVQSLDIELSSRTIATANTVSLQLFVNYNDSSSSSKVNMGEGRASLPTS